MIYHLFHEFNYNFLEFLQTRARRFDRLTNAVHVLGWNDRGSEAVSMFEMAHFVRSWRKPRRPPPPRLTRRVKLQLPTKGPCSRAISSRVAWLMSRALLLSAI